MKQILFTLITLVLCSLGVQAREYQTVAGDPMKARIYTLDNGLKVYLSVNKEKPRITAHIAVNTGHRNDPADCTGLAHYLEHLMFKGSHRFGTSNYEAEAPLIQKISDLYEEYRQLTDADQRKAKYHEIDSVSQLAAQYNIPNEYDKLMATIGSDGTNAYTWYDITNYTENIPSNEVQRWAEIQADRFQNLVLRGFHTELESVYEEKNISLSNDGEKVFDALFAKLFPSHSYGTQTTIGTQDHLKNPSLVEINKYYNKYYKPNNIAICMAGDFDPDEVIAIIEKEFGAWQPGNDITPRQFPAQPVFTQPQDTTVVGQEQEQIMLGWRFKGAASMQNDTLSMVSSILANGRCGLFDLDVNQKMLTLGASAGDMSLKDYSTFLLVGVPKEGQTLEQVKDILLAEITKLKNGEFDESLLTANINNLKRSYLQQMENNDSRVSKMVNAFINGAKWEDEIGQIDRMAKISKADIVAFANQYFTDGYVCAYKRNGEDTNIKKVEKPQITPIPTNRDKASDFLTQMAARTVEPIHPSFVDFDKDLTKAETKSKLPLLYVQNKDNSLFELTFRYDFGDRADAMYSYIGSYVDLLGTSKLSNEEIKKQMYELACDYSIDFNNETTSIRLSGLSENMPKALALLESVLNDAQPDKEIYDQYVANILKEREDAKKEQRTCFSYLWEYGVHGAKNDYTNILSEAQLKALDPAVLTKSLKNLLSYQHKVLYYGPMSVKELSSVLAKTHKTAKKLAAVPVNKEWNWEQTPTDEVLIAPYEANNIYMRMLHNEGKQLDLSKRPVNDLFNEYFGGGMNTIVFQELRESRGLAYNAWASFQFPYRKGIPEVWMEHIISQNDKMMDCINTFKEITDEMPQSEAAFQIAKQSYTKLLASMRTTKMGIINAYISAQRLGIDYNIYNKVYEALPSITLSDIVKFEQDNIKNKPLRYIILGNEKELDIPSLEKIGTIKRVTLEDIFGY